MTTDHNQQQDIGEDINYLSIWEIGVAFALLCFISTVFLYGLYLRVEHAEKDRKLVQAINPNVEQAIQRQKNDIETLSWADSEQGLVRVPISGAMQAVTAELNLQRIYKPAVEDEEPVAAADNTGEADAAEVTHADEHAGGQGN